MLAAIDPSIGLIGAALVTSVPAILAALWARSAKRELKPNGGTSTKDAVARIERWTVRTDQRLDRLEAAQPATED